MATVAIIGAGKMGTAIAHQLPLSTSKIIIDKNLGAARKLAEEVRGIYDDSYKLIIKADLVLLLIPAKEVSSTLIEIADIISPKTIVLNMATSFYALAEKYEQDMLFMDAKIIGHAKAIAKGEQGLIIVNTDNSEHIKLIQSQFSKLRVISGNPDLVEEINRICTIEAIKTAVSINKLLISLQIPTEWVDIAISTVCTETMKSYLKKDLGSFAQELVKKLESTDIDRV